MTHEGLPAFADSPSFKRLFGKLKALVFFEVEHEDRRRRWLRRSGIGRCHAGTGMLSEQVHHPIDLLLIGTDHERRVASSQKSAGARQSRRPEFFFEQRIHYGISIFVLNDGNDQLLHGYSLQ
jgi:hypothetical protein